jgi:hypothetical protein
MTNDEMSDRESKLRMRSAFVIRHSSFVIFFLLAFGAARVLPEAALEREQRAAGLRRGQLDLSMRQQAGQLGFVAALSGFRAIVADGFWIHAQTAWERVDWARMKLDFDIVTSLQPRCVLFWEVSAWHMSHNASIAALENEAQPRLALRVRVAREFIKTGEGYLLEGIANNPESPRLWDMLGVVYRDKLNDHCKAAWAYDQCAALPRAPGYAKRFAAYSLAQCPGREREAYERMRALYLRSADEHLPTLLKWLATLQEKLSVPPAERVYNPPPEKPVR